MGKENDRLVALKSSSKIVTSIVSSAMENGFNGFIVVVSNPVDIMTYVAYKVSGLPQIKLLDRVHYLIQHVYNVILPIALM